MLATRIGTNVALEESKGAELERRSMEPLSVTCDQCGQTAIVHSVRYRYEEDGKSRKPFTDHVLLETQWKIECPACGMRMQIETQEGS
jgi:Zn finger protein HypA/HybF involved in hydrogenase expression